MTATPTPLRELPAKWRATKAALSEHEVSQGLLDAFEQCADELEAALSARDAAGAASRGLILVGWQYTGSDQGALVRDNATPPEWKTDGEHRPAYALAADAIEGEIATWAVAWYAEKTGRSNWSGKIETKRGVSIDYPQAAADEGFTIRPLIFGGATQPVASGDDVGYSSADALNPNLRVLRQIAVKMPPSWEREALFHAELDLGMQIRRLAAVAPPAASGGEPWSTISDSQVEAYIEHRSGLTKTLAKALRDTREHYRRLAAVAPAGMDGPEDIGEGIDYRVVSLGDAYEPQMRYTSGQGVWTWFPLMADGYWLEPEAFSYGDVTKRSPMPEEDAERAILRARAINGHHIAPANAAPTPPATAGKE